MTKELSFLVCMCDKCEGLKTEQLQDQRMHAYNTPTIRTHKYTQPHCYGFNCVTSTSAPQTYILKILTFHVTVFGDKEVQ